MIRFQYVMFPPSLSSSKTLPYADTCEWSDIACGIRWNVLYSQWMQVQNVHFHSHYESSPVVPPFHSMIHPISYPISSSMHHESACTSEIYSSPYSSHPSLHEASHKTVPISTVRYHSDHQTMIQWEYRCPPDTRMRGGNYRRGQLGIDRGLGRWGPWGNSLPPAGRILETCDV